MLSPLISVVVPVLNEAHGLSDTLADLQGLRRAGHEILLVDGGSTDGSASLAEPHVDQCLQSPPGRARQMNLGAQRARGDVLWFVHADTRLSAAAIDQLLACLASTEALWGRFDVRLEPSSWLLKRVAGLMNRRSRWTGVATGDQGIFVRREVFERLGGYPDIPIMEDVALSKRLRSLARPCCLRTPLVTSSRRWLRRGVWRTIGLMWMLRLAYFAGVSPTRLRIFYR